MEALITASYFRLFRKYDGFSYHLRTTYPPGKGGM